MKSVSGNGQSRAGKTKWWWVWVVGWPWLHTRCPPSHFITSLLSRTQKRKIRTHGSIWRHFNKAKAKAMCESKGKQKVYSLLPISRQCPATSGEAGLQYMEWLLWKTNLIKSAPLLLLLSLSFYCWADIILHGISIWPVWVSCPGCVPSQDPAHLQPTGEEVES